MMFKISACTLQPGLVKIRQCAAQFVKNTLHKNLTQYKQQLSCANLNKF